MKPGIFYPGCDQGNLAVGWSARPQGRPSYQGAARAEWLDGGLAPRAPWRWVGQPDPKGAVATKAPPGQNGLMAGWRQWRPGGGLVSPPPGRPGYQGAVRVGWLDGGLAPRAPWRWVGQPAPRAPWLPRYPWGALRPGWG